MARLNRTLWLLTILAASASSSELKAYNDANNSLSRVSRHIDLDPHETLCWDVSIYLDVTFDQEPCEKCMPRLDTVKNPLKTQVCETVTETKCDIVGYTECITTEVQKTYKSQESGYDYFQTKECTPFTVEVDHWKEKYKCENVTKQNCVTKWKMLENGTKVWTGNDDCKEETWEECKPYRYPAKFEKDMVNCTDSIKIPYCNNCNQVLKPITTQSVTCKPKSAVQCKPVERRICTDVEWEDSEQEVIDICTPDMVWRPKQEISHEKRCLLDATIDGNVPALPPLGPEHPRIFNNPAPTYTPRYTTQAPPPRPTRPSYNVPNLVRESTYGAPSPRAPRGYGTARGEPLGPSDWLKARNL